MAHVTTLVWRYFFKLQYLQSNKMSFERQASALSNDKHCLCNKSTHSTGSWRAGRKTLKVLVQLLLTYRCFTFKKLFWSSYNAAARHSCRLCIIMKWFMQCIIKPLEGFSVWYFTLYGGSLCCILNGYSHI